MVDRKKHVQELIEGAQVFRRKSKASASLIEKELTPAQWMLAAYVAAHEGETTNTVAKALEMTGSAVTQLVNVLVKKGYVKRVPHPEDRRAFQLVLSGASRKRIDAYRGKQIEEILKVYEVLTDKEFETLAALNKKVMESMNM